MKRAHLQLAVDLLELDPALALAQRVYPHFDIVEVGTPLIIEHGLAAVERLKAQHPDRQVLADTKIMDAGNLEATSAFRRGADIVTVLALADDTTVRGALEAAQEAGGRIMADLINAPDPAQRGAELVELGVHILCVHTAYDRRDAGVDPLGELAAVRGAVGEHALVAVAGGMKLATAREAAQRGADIVVVGGAIANASDPGAAAAAIAQALRETEHG